MTLSVLMAVHGGDDAAHLRQALESLAAQTRRADEVVLVEDGPLPAALAEAVAAFREPLGIVPLALPANSGLGAALAAGLDRCKGAFVARMDADDVCLPERFAAQLARFAADPALDLLGSPAIEIDAEGAQTGLRRVPEAHEAIVRDLWLNPFIHPSVMARTARLRAAGGYDAGLRRRQDYELWFRCARAGLRLANTTEPLLLYRFTPATLRRQSAGSAWEQGVIGFRGARSLGMPLWQQLACFVPFVRSLLPGWANRALYRWTQAARSRRMQAPGG